MIHELKQSNINLSKPTKGLLASRVSSSAGFFLGVLKMETKKRCPKCKQSKTISGFHKDRNRKDGYCCWCKVCCSKHVKKYNKSERYKAIRKQYEQSEEGKVAIKRYRQSEKGKIKDKHYYQSEKGKASSKLYYSHHPEEHKARQAINNAITSGKLPRPDTLLCHYCPKPAQEYHHWHGYEMAHWLDVIQVCRNCHIKCEKKNALLSKIKTTRMCLQGIKCNLKTDSGDIKLFGMNGGVGGGCVALTGHGRLITLFGKIMS